MRTRTSRYRWSFCYIYPLQAPKRHKLACIIYLFYFIFPVLKQLDNGQYILGSIAIAIHFQTMINSVQFRYQIFIRLGIKPLFASVFPHKSFTCLCYLLILNLFCAICLPRVSFSTPVLRRCFLPCWSIVDLFSIFIFTKLLVAENVYTIKPMSSKGLAYCL